MCIIMCIYNSYIHICEYIYICNYKQTKTYIYIYIYILHTHTRTVPRRLPRHPGEGAAQHRPGAAHAGPRIKNV